MPSNDPGHCREMLNVEILLSLATINVKESDSDFACQENIIFPPGSIERGEAGK